MNKILFDKMTDDCSCCGNQTLSEESDYDLTKKQHFLIKIKDIWDVYKNIKNTKQDILISFFLKENDLNLSTGKKILKLFARLRKDNISFKVLNPLPRCILGFGYGEAVNEFSLPKGCYECRELFTIKNEEIISCRYINKKGPKIYYMKDRNQIWEFFNTLRLEKDLTKTCINCLYLKRKLCDGVCFRS